MECLDSCAFGSRVSLLPVFVTMLQLYTNENKPGKLVIVFQNAAANQTQPGRSTAVSGLLKLKSLSATEFEQVVCSLYYNPWLYI